MLILALSPAESFYGPRNGFSLNKRGVEYHWPIFLMFFVVGSFYTLSGLNKIVDVGPHWPFVLHLEKLAAVGIENALFVSNRYVNPVVSSFHLSYNWSVVAGWISLVGELGFISILFLPRFRWFFVGSMVALHVLVFLMAGINFVSSSLILLLCVDWNVFVRKVNVYYDEKSNFQLWARGLIERFDWFSRVRMHPIASLKNGNYEFDVTSMKVGDGMTDENGDCYYGLEACEQVAIRCPLLWGLAMICRIPGVSGVFQYVFRIVGRADKERYTLQ
jgi:hypothetical protein